ncbi:MAG: DUF4079 domain-containing protein [Prochloraceae cyanobacterium]|nr:DUF4079 domain-containing protein [Prochloraceae cyanobacterium]
MNSEILEAVKTWSQFLHPILMWVLLGISIYALYLGWQIRRTRTADKNLRKELLKKNFNNRHYRIGSIILALMVLGTIGAMGVTYVNNDKLFVAPHLIAGLAMTGAISTAAALVPFMQKGNEFARLSHITLMVGMLILFAWQAFTGMEILQRIVDKI